MPMQLNVPVDIADIVQSALNAHGVTACAEPLPRNLGASLPLTLVQPMGGSSRQDVALDRFAVRLYTYADEPETAISTASLAIAALCLIEGEVVDGTQVYHVQPTSMAYPANDPDHPTLSRACSTAYVWARATTTDI